METENAVGKAGRRGKLAGTLIAGAVLALAAVPAAGQAALTVPTPEPRQITTPQPVQSIGGASPSTPGSGLPATAAVPTPGAVVLTPTGTPSPPPASQQPPRTSIDCPNCTADAIWLYRQEVIDLEIQQWDAIKAGDEQRYNALTQQLEKVEERWSHEHIRVDREALAQEAAARQQRMQDADEYAEEHDDDAIAERAELADQYAQAQGYPAAGSFLGLLQPVFDLFEYGTPVKAGPQASASPVGHSMPESPNGEPLAAVSVRTLLGPPDTNSSKF